MVKCGPTTPEEVVLERTANRILHRAGFRLDGTPERPERRHKVHTIRMTDPEAKKVRLLSVQPEVLG